MQQVLLPFKIWSAIKRVLRAAAGDWNRMAGTVASAVSSGLFREEVLRVAAGSVNEAFNTCAGASSCTESQQPAWRSSEHNLEGNFLRLEKGNNSLGSNILRPLYQDILF